MNLLLKSSPYFSVLHKFLREVGYSEPSICQRLDIPSLSVLVTRQRRNVQPPTGNDPISLLIRLFLMGASIERDIVEAALSGRILAAMVSLGLLETDSGASTNLASSVALYPVGTHFIISDRWFAHDAKDYRAPDDIVYPAITPNTVDFMANLPATPCRRFLELCSGTAAVALAAAQYSSHSWAVDVTERSTLMGEFNRLLNGLENVTILKGDLYEGLDGLTFDRIVAHPPYMPVLRPAQIFYDGGSDGERITRRCVEGLPRFLSPGGSFYCQAQGSDRKGAQLEDRVRAWLGGEHEDFDVAVIEKHAQSPKDAAYIYALKSRGGLEAVDQMLESLENLGVDSMAYGLMVVQRKREMRRAFTVRRSAGRRTGPEEIEWLLKWEAFAASPETVTALAEMIPMARPSLELRTTYRLKNGDLAPEQFALHTDEPFSMDCKVQPWVGFLIPLCDGKRTAGEIFETCKAHGLIHAETPLHEFYDLLKVLISGGFLEVAEYPPPSPNRATLPSVVKSSLQDPHL